MVGKLDCTGFDPREANRRAEAKDRARAAIRADNGPVVSKPAKKKRKSRKKKVKK